MGRKSTGSHLSEAWVKWWKGIDLGSPHGAHVVGPFVTRTDGHKIVLVDGSDSRFVVGVEVCNEPACGPGKLLRGSRIDADLRSKPSFTVKAARVAAGIRALSSLKAGKDDVWSLHFDVHRPGIPGPRVLMTTDVPGVGSGEWEVDASRWGGDKVTGQFNPREIRDFLKGSDGPDEDLVILPNVTDKFGGDGKPPWAFVRPEAAMVLAQFKDYR